MSQFAKLMSELEVLGTDQEQMTKALPADDGKDEEKIQAAAEDGGLEVGGEGKPEGGAPNPEDEEGKAPMAKSFKFTLEDGTEVEAQDGGEMVKALQDRIEVNEGEMIKALGTAVTLIKGQGELIKSMQGQINKLSGEGRGRKAVVSVVEKTNATEVMTKSLQPEGMSHDVFFAKALTAQREGRINGLDIAMAESCLNRGEPIPAALVTRVTG